MRIKLSYIHSFYNVLDVIFIIIFEAHNLVTLWQLRNVLFKLDNLVPPTRSTCNYFSTADTEQEEEQEVVILLYRELYLRLCQTAERLDLNVNEFLCGK